MSICLYMVSEFIAKCISIRKDQQEFLDGERSMFKLSKFVQAKLDEYIKLRKDYKQFMEDKDEEKI